jgi:hypothetical protein
VRTAWHSYRPYFDGRLIRRGKFTLRVEERDFYTWYQLENEYGVRILSHDVRSPEPLPIRPAQIIYARTIPWFMWIIYGVRDGFWKLRWNWQTARAARKERIRQKAIRVLAEKHMGDGRFRGRYNR